MDFDCWDWKAIQNNMPGPDDHGTLTITGTCGKFPTDFYELSLVRRRDGINPFEPFFDLVVKEPSGGAPEILSDEPVTHIMNVARDSKYTKVTIWYEDKPRWNADVEQAA